MLVVAISTTCGGNVTRYAPLILYFFFPPVRSCTPSTQSPGKTAHASTQNAYQPVYASAACVSHRPIHHSGLWTACVRFIRIESKAGGQPWEDSLQPK